MHPNLDYLRHAAEFHETAERQRVKTAENITKAVDLILKFYEETEVRNAVLACLTCATDRLELQAEVMDQLAQSIANQRAEFDPKPPAFHKCRGPFTYKSSCVDRDYYRCEACQKEVRVGTGENPPKDHIREPLAQSA